MCIGYAFRPRLSSRLTRSGRTFLLKPEAFGHYDSHIILATHSGILTRIHSTTASAMTSPRIRRSPTPAFPEQNLCFSHCILNGQFDCFAMNSTYSQLLCSRNASPSFGVHFSPVEFSAQNHSTSELLRTLLMSGCF